MMFSTEADNALVINYQRDSTHNTDLKPVVLGQFELINMIILSVLNWTCDQNIFEKKKDRVVWIASFYISGKLIDPNFYQCFCLIVLISREYFANGLNASKLEILLLG